MHVDMNINLFNLTQISAGNHFGGGVHLVVSVFIPSHLLSYQLMSHDCTTVQNTQKEKESISPYIHLPVASTCMS